MSKVELEVISKIKNHFKDRYVIFDSKMITPRSFSQLCIQLKYDFNLMMSVHFNTWSYDNLVEFSENAKFSLKLWCGVNHRELSFKLTDSDSNYLNEIEKCINELMEQIKLYEEFIEGFVDSVVDDLYNVEYIKNLNTGYTYFKSDNGRAVIYPVLEFGHSGEYVTMHIDSIDGGNYPMKLYSSISFDDAKEMLDFYL